MSNTPTLQNVSMDIDDVETPTTPESQPEQNSQGQTEPPKTDQELHQEVVKEGEKPPVVPQTETPDQKTEGDQGHGTNVPFHETPAFKQRIQEIEGKYSSQAKSWAIINEIAQEDPDYALLTIEKMEKKGALKPGSYELAKKQLYPNGKPGEQAPVQNQPVQPNINNPQQQNLDRSEWNKLIENHPAVKFAKTLQEQETAKTAAAEEAAVNFLITFENKHPEIANSPNPELTRARIGAEAKALRAENPKLSDEEVLEMATKWVCHRDTVLKDYKEKGEISAALRNIQENASNANVTSVAGSSGSASRALSAEEKRGKELMGFKTDQEYIDFINDPNSGIVD